MVSITLSIPEDVREQMKRFSEINWSRFVRVSIEEKVKKLSWKEQMLQQLKSEGEYDKLAIEIGDKIKQGVWKRHKQKGW